MGQCCATESDEKTADNVISNKQHKDRILQKQTICILLLGAGDSGKTTIMKQMRKVHKSTITNDDTSGYVLPIRQSLVAGLVKLCRESKKLHESLKLKTVISEKSQSALNVMLNLEHPLTLNDEIKEACFTLWQDEGIQETWKYRSYYNISENLSYFMKPEKLKEVFSENYNPTFDDWLKCRLRTTGCSEELFETTIDDCPCKFNFIDVGGQRSERKKWMYTLMDNVDACIYVVSVGDYNKTLFEDEKTKRLDESLQLFGEIKDLKFFQNRSTILFFNKYDLLESKIRETPFTVAFDDFPEKEKDPHSPQECINFLFDKFLEIYQEPVNEEKARRKREQMNLQENSSTREIDNPKQPLNNTPQISKLSNNSINRQLHFHITTALDTDMIKKTMKDIQKDLIQKRLHETGFL